MKPLRILIRALLIICIIVIYLCVYKFISKVDNIPPFSILFIVGPQALLLMSLLIPNIPFAPYIAAASGFLIGMEAAVAGIFISIEVKGPDSLIGMEATDFFTGYNVAIMLTIWVLVVFIFPYAAYRWVSDMRNRKAAPWGSDSTRNFYKRTKVVIPPGAEGRILLICVFFVMLVAALNLFTQMLIEEIESGIFDFDVIMIVFCMITVTIISVGIMWKYFEEVREAFRKSHSFTDSIDSTTMELAAHDYNNAERLLDGRISLGDKYIFGSETEVFLEYDKLSAIIAAAVPDSDIAGIIGPIPIEMAEAIAVDPYERKQTEHQLFAETTDGEVYLLCHTPATNGFQTYEKYWKRELCPVFKRIHERNPNCWFYPKIEI